MYSDIVIYDSMASFIYLEFVLRELTVGVCCQLSAYTLIRLVATSTWMYIGVFKSWRPLRWNIASS